MEARDSWIAETWSRLFAIPIAILIGFFATAAEVLGLASGPLVPLYLLAAMLGLGLSGRQYRPFVAIISICLIIPIWFQVPAEGRIPISEVVQRLSGLICLGLLAIVADRTRSKPRGDASTLISIGGLDPDQWVRALVVPEAVSDLNGVGSSSKERQQGKLQPETMNAHEPITSNLTRIRKAKTPGDPWDNCDEELSFDFDDSQNHHLQIVRNLRASGSFDDEQLQLIEQELSSAMRIKPNIDVGAPIEHGVQVGRFIVDEPLGRGGEGNVYRGHDVNGETAAIKILHNMRVSDRFRREMHLVRQMAHPNIVTAYEVGEFRGLPFITMELLHGPDLHVLVRDSGPLTWQVSSRHILQAARALAHAHDRDLVHRDIKPGNLILNGDGVIKLVDLGLASMGGGEGEIDSVFQFETQEGHLAGTLPYMAPEQARSLSHATVQSDVYGLGATWFYLLTGRERLRGKTFSRQFENLLLRRRFNALPARALPEPLRQVYRRMVAYHVRDRYADCGELAVDLESALTAAGESVAAVEDINVLVVEDSRTDMVLTIEMLRRLNPALSIHEARTLKDGLGICRSLDIDLVLLDLSLPDSSGIETVTRFRSVMRSVPLVVLTGMSQEEVGSQCLTAGANTFISKSGLTPHRMERTIFVTLSRCGLPKKVS